MFEDTLFKRKKLNVDKLLDYGFERRENDFLYVIDILDSQFALEISIQVSGIVTTRVLDHESGGEYVLYKTSTSVGAFVGEVRSACERVLTDIAEKCFEPDVFKTKQAHQIIDYVEQTYGDKLEFLWTKFPDNAIWRRKDNEKWYGAILTVSRKKLGLESNEMAEIIDLRISPELIGTTIDNKRYFPGWHMNKKSWYTIILDETVSTKEICSRIDESYYLAQKG